MKAKDIAELLDEPACTHNKKEKSGCAKPTPGATDGGCAFDGAQIALLPIADVAHIVHGPIACAGSSWDNRGTRSSGPQLYRIGMTTDLSEQDVIMGRAEKRLFHAIRQAVESYAPPAVFVYNTCVPALIGDDLDAVCKAASEHFATPVVPVDGAGFYGTKNLGNRIAGLGKNKKTAVFPKLVFAIKDGLNHKPGDPNYDIKQLALECASKRMYPDILNHDQVVKVTGSFKTPMGCRSFLGAYEENGELIHEGRNNIGVVSLNLPRIALKSRDEADFWDRLDAALRVAKKALMYRIERLDGAELLTFRPGRPVPSAARG